jgi:hypothetical protein
LWVATNHAIARTESAIKPVTQRIGIGQRNRDLAPDPEALVVDRFLSK